MPLDRKQKALLKALGQNVKNRRQAAGLTQEQLAEKADLNWRTVQKIEAGQLNVLITTAARLKDGIGCRWEELLD